MGDRQTVGGNRISLRDAEMEAIRQEAVDFVGAGLYRYRCDNTVIFMERNMLWLFEINDRHQSMLTRRASGYAMRGANDARQCNTTPIPDPG
jgi:hypothetical protein